MSREYALLAIVVILGKKSGSTVLKNAQTAPFLVWSIEFSVNWLYDDVRNLFPCGMNKRHVNLKAINCG